MIMLCNRGNETGRAGAGDRESEGAGEAGGKKDLSLRSTETRMTNRLNRGQDNGEHSWF